MSEIRTSTPPVPPMSGDAIAPKPIAKKAPAKKPLSAAKASKPAKAIPLVKVATRVNAKGESLRCDVPKCGNPGRHPHGKGFTCTTHHKAIVRGKAVTVLAAGKAVWVSPTAAKAPAKPASGKAAKTA